MRLKFKQQAFQMDAVKAEVDCFAGQPKSRGQKYALGRKSIRKFSQQEQSGNHFSVPPLHVLHALHGKFWISGR